MAVCLASIPVVLRCEDIFVAIPQHILVKESTFFNAKFARWEKKDSDEEEGQESDEDGDVDTQQDDNSDGPTAKRTKFDENETAQVIEIKGYIPEAVKLLFESIQGYKDALENCGSVHVLGDVLLLCDFYGIPTPDYIQIRPTMDNYFECFKVVESLEKLDSLKEMAEDIAEKCINRAEIALSSAKSMKDFVLDHRDNTELVHKLLQKLDNIKDERRCEDCDVRKVCLECNKKTRRRNSNSNSPARRRSPPRRSRPQRGPSSSPPRVFHSFRIRRSWVPPGWERLGVEVSVSPDRSASRRSSPDERSERRSRSRSDPRDMDSRRGRSRSDSRDTYVGRSRDTSRDSRSRSRSPY